MKAIAIRATVLGATVVGGLVGAPVGAQTSGTPAAAGGLDEIVVTATRRELRLQDVPISVSAFSQEKLDAEGLKNIDDLTRLAPGVAFTRSGLASTSNYNDENSDISIRGIDSTAGTSTTGIYIDDTPIQTRHIGFGAINPYPALFDLDRVEVLRGPQGTLFGAGAEGGAVRFIAPAASLDKFTGYARSELSSTAGGNVSYEGGVAVGGPIIDNVFGVRISASYRRDGGWVDRASYTLSSTADPLTPLPVYSGTTQSSANWQQTSTFRLAAKWKATDALSVSPSLYYQKLDINDTAAYWPDLSNPGSDKYRNGNARTNPSSDPFWLGSVKLEWDLGGALLTTNTSYLSRDLAGTSDYSQYLRATWTWFGVLPSTFAPAGAGGYAVFGDTQRNFYQEVRLASTDTSARLTWNAGLFYSHLNENVPEDIIDPTFDAEIQAYTHGAAALCSAALPCPNGLIYTGQLSRVVDKQLAAFGEVDFKFTETLKATLGLRFSKIDFTGSVGETGPFLGETIVTESSGSEKPVTPKVVLSWQPDRDHLAYLSAAKGFRPGGVNVGVGKICGSDLVKLGLPLAPGGTDRAVPAQFQSDSLWSYEVGSKNSFFDHSLQVNASVFYIDWSNILQNVYLPSCGEQFGANLGKATSKGADIEVLYRPTPALTLNVAVAYTDARYTKSSCAGVLSFDPAAGQCTGVDPTTGTATAVAPITSDGNALFGPKWTATAAAEMHFPDWRGRAPYVRLDYQYVGAQAGTLPIDDPRNAINDPTQPPPAATPNLSLRAGLRYSGIDLSLFANNLTDAHPLLTRARDIYDTDTDRLYFERGVRPRTFGLTGTYHF